MVDFNSSTFSLFISEILSAFKNDTMSTRHFVIFVLTLCKYEKTPAVLLFFCSDLRSVLKNDTRSAGVVSFFFLLNVGLEK
jgi:hypothetical protein